MQGRSQEVTIPVEIFQANLEGIVVNEEADPPILAPKLAVQTIPTLSLCRTTVKTVVTDGEN